MNAVYSNRNIIFLGRKIKDRWLELQGKVSHELEKQAEKKTMLKQDKIEEEKPVKFRSQHLVPRTLKEKVFQSNSKQAWDSKDIKEHKKYGHPDIKKKRQLQRSNNSFGESSNNQRDQSLDTEADLIESFNRVLKPLHERNSRFKPNPNEIKGDNLQFINQLESPYNSSSYNAVDFRRTKSNNFNPNRNIFPVTKFENRNSHFESLNTETNVTKSKFSYRNNRAGFRRTKWDYFNRNRNIFSAAQFNKHNSHFESLNTETKVTNSNFSNRNNTVDFRRTKSNYLNPNRNIFPATQFNKHNSHFGSLNTETYVTNSNFPCRMSLLNHHESASQNINFPIQFLSATPSHFSVPNHFQMNFLNPSHTFPNPGSQYMHNYPPPSYQSNPSASKKLKHSSHFFPNPPISPPLPNPFFSTHPLNSSQSQIISNQSSLNPPTFSANPLNPSPDITESALPDHYSYSRDPQNYLIPSNSSNEPDNFPSSNPLNGIPVLFDDPTLTDPSDSSPNLPNPAYLNPSDSYPFPNTPVSLSSLNQWNASNSYNAFPTRNLCNRLYAPNPNRHFPSQNPSNYYPFSNPFNPYLQNFNYPLHVLIPTFNEDGSVTFTNDTNDQGSFLNF